MTQRVKRRRRSLKRKLMIAAILLAVVGSGIAFGLLVYPRISKHRLLQRAQVSIDSKDYRGARISLRRAWEIDKDDVAVNRKMAELAEAIGTGEALYWRKRVVELEPQNDDNHVALIERAIQTRNLAALKDATQEFVKVGKDKALAHYQAGRAALVAKDPATAIHEYAEAVNLQPQNDNYRYELAEVQLTAGIGNDQAVARPVVQAAVGKPGYEIRATRALIQDAALQKDTESAIRLSEELQRRPDATFADHIAHLSLLRQLNDPGYAAYLSVLQESAASSPDHAYKLISWLTLNGSALVAVDWSKRLPKELISTMPVPLAVAQAYAVLGDWAGLAPLVSDPVASANGDVAPDSANNWSEYEFMRFALRAWTLRGEGSEKEARIEWNKAVTAAAKRPAALSLLANAANNWGWIKEADEVLWSLAEQPEFAKGALGLLNRRYFEARNTRGLQRVASRMAELDPADLSSKNNVAAFAMLLDDPKLGLSIAEEIHRAQPENPDFTSTYAFALHLHGRTEEAVKLMKTLGEERLKQPAFAAYYGIMLASMGNRDEARTYLDAGSKAALLPEEEQLVAAARARVQ